MNLEGLFRVLIVALTAIVANGAQAQSWQLLNSSYALKSGESVEVMDLYWVIDCESQLLSPPEVTILDGPPGVSASIDEAMVTPRMQQCSKPVKGAKLKLSAGKIEDHSHTTMTIRVRFQTLDGERQSGMSFNVTLFP